MNQRTYTLLRLFVIALLLVTSAAIPYAMRAGTPNVQAADSGGPVVVEDALELDPPTIRRELFNDGTLGENLIAAGEWIQANDPCTVYAVDYDPGFTEAVEIFYLEECFGEEGR